MHRLDNRLGGRKLPSLPKSKPGPIESPALPMPERWREEAKANPRLTAESDWIVALPDCTPLGELAGRSWFTVDPVRFADLAPFEFELLTDEIYLPDDRRQRPTGLYVSDAGTGALTGTRRWPTGTFSQRSARGGRQRRPGEYAPIDMIGELFAAVGAPYDPRLGVRQFIDYAERKCRVRLGLDETGTDVVISYLDARPALSAQRIEPFVEKLKAQIVAELRGETVPCRVAGCTVGSDEPEGTPHIALTGTRGSGTPWCGRRPAGAPLPSRERRAASVFLSHIGLGADRSEPTGAPAS